MLDEPEVNAEHTLDLQVQEALFEKVQKFVPTDLPVLKEIVDQFHKRLPVPDPEQPGAQDLSAELEADHFALMMKQVQYDIDVFRVYLGKRATAATATYHAKLQWRRAQQVQSQQSVQKWLQLYCRVVHMTDMPRLVSELTDFSKSIQTKLRLSPDNVAPPFV